ncbi:MAG: DNA primase [Oscillospiraceae bacterium]|nr:DNA primase [Oscillospiraceae bacterium]
MLPQEFIYQLKQANPIEQVMGSYVQLIRAGSLLKCNCPFHSEKTPSCVVYADTQDPHFYCFGCHAGGDVISFIRQIEGIGYMDAVRMLAERAGMTVPSQSQDNREENLRMRLLELNRAAANYYYKQLTGPDKRGLVYLKERALRPDIIKKYGLGFAGEQWDGLLKAMKNLGFTDEELILANLCSRSQKTGNLYDRFRSRVIFPIIDLRGNVIAFGGRTIEKDGEPKYLNSSDTPVFKKGRNLFSMNFAKKSQSKRLILAEGYMDVIAVHQAGFENVVASLGTALTPDQCRLMRQYADEVVISYDSDAAGQNATVKAVNLLRAVGLRPRILHMHDAKDPDEYIKKFGAPYFRKLLEDADDALTYELQRCRDGTDPESEDGTITALHKAVSVLAGIANELDRNVYLSRVAKDYDINPEILKAQVEREIRKRKAGAKKQDWKNRVSLLRPRDPVNPEATQHQREATAEEYILCYLFRQPDALESVLARIKPEEFVTAFHRKVYERLAEMLQQGYDFSLSLFSGEDFTPDETGRITGIPAKYEEIDISPQTVEDCIRTLKQRPMQDVDVANLSDADASAFFAQIRQNKR